MQNSTPNFQVAPQFDKMMWPFVKCKPARGNEGYRISAEVTSSSKSETPSSRQIVHGTNFSLEWASRVKDAFEPSCHWEAFWMSFQPLVAQPTWLPLGVGWNSACPPLSWEDVQDGGETAPSSQQLDTWWTYLPTHHTRGVPLPGWSLWGLSALERVWFYSSSSACSVTSVMSNSLRPYGLQPTRLLCLWAFSGKNTGVGCHFLLQGIFSTQGSNPRLLGLLHCRQILLCWAIGEAPPSYRPESNSKGRVEKEVRAFRFSSIYWVHCAPWVVQRYRTLPANAGDMGPIPGWEDPVK